jgi:hypothetical protein
MKKTIIETPFYDSTKGVKRFARERVGQPRAVRTITPRKKRRPKHKSKEANELADLS